MEQKSTNFDLISITFSYQAVRGGRFPFSCFGDTCALTFNAARLLKSRHDLSHNRGLNYSPAGEPGLTALPI